MTYVTIVIVLIMQNFIPSLSKYERIVIEFDKKRIWGVLPHSLYLFCVFLCIV